jgi:flagellar biosynthesis protein FliP
MPNMDALPGWVSIFLLFLLGTGFVKIFTVLTALRLGLGLQGSSFGVVTLPLALALTCLLLGANPIVEKLFSLKGETAQDAVIVDQALTPFVEKHTDASVKDRLVKVVSRVQTQQDPQPTSAFGLRYSAFLVTEIREAFQLAVVILVPFLVVDLFIAHVLTLLGVVQISTQAIAIPIKLLIFLMVDGWTLIVEKVLMAYG